jgi:hypothetical protein
MLTLIAIRGEDSLLLLESVKTEEYHRRLQIMNYAATLETYEQLTSEQKGVEQLPVSTKRRLPAAPFPRKYVLSVFVDLQDARQAAYALRAAGFDERGIHILQSHDLVEAVAQDQSPFDIVTSIDYDIYLREARRERSFLAVRPIGYAQLKQIRDLLAPHHAYLANYIDTWTLTEILS